MCWEVARNEWIRFVFRWLASILLAFLTCEHTGSCLKTHDFLQPLERLETKGSAKEEATDEISWVVEKAGPSVEHLLPGGIGTYSINHISYVNNNNNNNNQRLPKAETSLFVRPATSTDRNDENSNCSSYTTSSGFTLWEDSSAGKRDKTGKENNSGDKPSIGGKP